MEAVWKRPRGVKRLKTLDKIEDAKSSRKKHFDNKPTHDPLPSSSGSEISDEEHVSGEPVLFDNLLKALGSASEKLSGLYKRRLREQEGKSDSEEDNDGGSLSASVSEEDSGEEGSECGPTEVMDQSEGDATGDESSDGDAMHDFEDNGDIVNGTENTSSYHVHLRYILPNEEVDKLNKKKWQFKWEMPAIGMSMSKWVGTGENVLKEVNSDQDYGVKQKLFDHWTNIYKNIGSKDLHLLRQKYFFSLCNSYRDILHCNKKPFYQRAKEEDSSIMDAYIMHALNHVYHTRDRVTKNDAKLNKHQESTKEEILSGGSFLDQGFTRPKVLILLPLGSIALRVVKRLIQLTPLTNKANVEHFVRFSDEFETIDGEGEDDMNGVSSKTKKPGKPADFQALFGGNNNDHFMMGIKFTKRSIKLYSDFYSSDIIVASPLGLITKIGDAEVEKEKDVDYLSSIEILIIDHADVIGMQNWSHVNTVVEHLNRTPSKQHGTDVMRIRQWYLDGHARFYRQTILLGSFLNPEMNALFNRLCVNYEGKVKLISEYKGILPKVLLQVRQVYERFAATSVVDADDTRLDYFCKKVFPKIKDSIEGHTMLFISSYFEFVRIRNFLKSQNASFCLLGEYTKPSDISRARTWFYEGKRKIMLYTERAHFYHRYKIRGIQNLIVYSLPERKEFYPEIINMLEGSKNTMCTVLFSCFDQLRLERIVGTSAAKRMLSSDKGIFVFC